MAGATDDPLSPPAPRDAEFDLSLDAWVFSRYQDVLAAFREPLLWPAGPRREPNLKIPDESAQQKLRTETLSALSAANLAQWQRSFQVAAKEIVERLPCVRPVEIVSELVEPFCLAAAKAVTGADSDLMELAREISAATADPLDAGLRLRASAANAELSRHFPQGAVPADAPTFIALARTLACLLANAWVALLRHPAEFDSLRERPELVPRAIEELLRYAGLPQAMFRSAMADVELCGVKLAAGDRVILSLASANRDAAPFPEPDRLDFTRRGAAHLSFGFGPHACVGAALIRMAAAVATQAFAARFSGSEICGPVVWTGGSGFRTPARFYVPISSSISELGFHPSFP